MSEEKDEKFILSEDQKKYILSSLDKKSLIDLTKEISGNKDADGRNKWGRAIREFLAEEGKKAKTTKFEALGDLELTTDQISAIENNITKVKNTLELTRIVFANEKLSQLSREFKAVYKAAQEFGPEYIKKSDEVAEEYQPPGSVYNLIPLVNKYVQNRKKENEPIYVRAEMKALPPQDLKNLNALFSYMNIYRFVQQATRYTRRVDRELFESTFIRHTYDKSDLLEEELEQYMTLSSKIVTASQLEEEILMYKDAIEESMTDANGKKVYGNFIEALNYSRDKLAETQKTIDALIKGLTGSRSERMKNRVDANASVLNLVTLWKNKKDRDQMIKMAQKRQQDLREEVERLSSMDSLKAEIFGLNRDNITR